MKDAKIIFSNGEMVLEAGHSMIGIGFSIRNEKDLVLEVTSGKIEVVHANGSVTAVSEKSSLNLVPGDKWRLERTMGVLSYGFIGWVE